MSRRTAHGVDVKAAIVSGLAAGAVYVATMEIDNRLTGQEIDDLKLLGFPFSHDPVRAKLVGVPIHLANSVIITLVYAKVARRWLPGPAWLRGVIYANIENTLLYPLAILEPYHPGIRSGELDRYLTLKAYLQSIPRHLAYGAVMASLYRRLSSSAAR